MSSVSQRLQGRTGLERLQLDTLAFEGSSAWRTDQVQQWNPCKDDDDTDKWNQECDYFVRHVIFSFCGWVELLDGGLSICRSNRHACSSLKEGKNSCSHEEHDGYLVGV
jgi:hypothetical protein